MSSQPFFHFIHPGYDPSQKYPCRQLYSSIKASHKIDELTLSYGQSIEKELTRFIAEHQNQWIFLFVSYDASVDWIGNVSTKSCPLSFPILHICTAKFVEVNLSEQLTLNNRISHSIGQVKQFLSKEQYKTIFEKIQHHLQRGDIYEMNYCIPFVANAKSLDDYEFWKLMVQKSPMPFSTYFKLNHQSLLSASPERFISGNTQQILSQPMKGTLGKKENISDTEAIHALKSNAKEQSENVMIVDLVRNDMSKIALKNSVKVTELFGVYSFPRVYQMISTVTADLKNNTSMFDILKALFPMGSMTGAPKRKAMELIHEYEVFQRGPFSGAVGYIDPEGNFDFSVLIRSVFYDQQQLYFSAGSAITVQSQVDSEYNECLMKASAIFDVINEYNANATHR